MARAWCRTESKRCIAGTCSHDALYTQIAAAKTFGDERHLDDLATLAMWLTPVDVRDAILKRIGEAAVEVAAKKEPRHPSETIAPGGGRAWLCGHGYKYDGPCTECRPTSDTVRDKEMWARALAVALKPEDILGPINIKEMVQTNYCSAHGAYLGRCTSCTREPVKVLYLDSSASTHALRSRFVSIGCLYMSHGWTVVEFSDYTRAFQSGSPAIGGSTRPRTILEDLERRMPLGTPAQVQIITDEVNRSFAPIQQQYHAEIHTFQNDGEFYRLWHHLKNTLTGTTTPNPTTTRPQEASMTARPSVITTVSLSQAENIVIADLKSLIAEVERVGGDDTAQVRLNQSAYRWDVTLSVKANEVEPEPAPLTPEQESDLLTEYRASGTSKTRKAEIKKALGL